MMVVELEPALGVVLASIYDAVDVSPPGSPIRVSWAPAAGATVADVTTGEISIGDATVTAPMGALAVTDAGDAVDVTIPGGRRVRALTLSGLKVSGGGELRSSADLRALYDAEAGGSLRLAVFTIVGGKWTPLCVVPELGARGVLPAQLTGASFQDGALTLPDPATAKLRLQLVRGEAPESLAGQSTELAGAQGIAAIASAGLKLTGPDGAVVWAFGGELPAAAQVVDLRTPVTLALEAALKAGAAPDVTFLLAGAAGMQAVVQLTGPHGALVRTFGGTLKTELAGDPVALATGATALTAEAPAGATADVAIRYHGIRLHDAIRDPLPTAPGGVAGPVVAGAPVVRALPPTALRDHAVALVGPVGRAPEGCSLSVELVDLSAGPPRRPLGPPGTLELAAGDALGAAWVTMPELSGAEVPAGVSVRTTAGRFLWAAGADGTPLLRLAVHDPDPGGRHVRIGTATIAAPTAAETTLPATALPAAALQGPAAPLLSSDLFCTVELADLTLRYPR